MTNQKIKRTPESEEFNRLKGLDFEFESPQDEYSYQPDSGSVANGEIGKVEYGIDIEEDAKTPHKKFVNRQGSEGNPDTPIPGESEWSQDHRNASEVQKNLK